MSDTFEDVVVVNSLDRSPKYAGPPSKACAYCIEKRPHSALMHEVYAVIDEIDKMDPPWEEAEEAEEGGS